MSKLNKTHLNVFCNPGLTSCKARKFLFPITDDICCFMSFYSKLRHCLLSWINHHHQALIML